MNVFELGLVLNMPETEINRVIRKARKNEKLVHKTKNDVLFKVLQVRTNATFRPHSIREIECFEQHYDHTIKQENCGFLRIMMHVHVRCA